MAVSGIATPRLLRDPGYLFGAPVGTALPTHTAAGSRFTDTWPVAWVPLGATEEGSSFSSEQTVETISVAEFLNPVASDVTETSTSLAFALANWTLKNLQRALNGGSLVTTGSGATAVTELSPPTPSEIVRTMIGWESLDSTVRLVIFQGLNGGTVETSFRKSPDKALIPFQVNAEQPQTGTPYKFWAAGMDRVGV